jgi:hypothetical protein
MIIQSAPQTADVRANLSSAGIIPEVDNAVTTIIVGEIFYTRSLRASARVHIFHEKFQKD